MASLPFDALIFENMELDGRIDKGLLSLEKADFSGEFSGSMRGNVRFMNEIKRSRLAITGELNLPDSVKKSLGPLYDSSGQANRFSLRGSIERPRFRMMGIGVPRMPPGASQEVGAAGLPQQALDRRAQARQEAISGAQAPAASERRLPEKDVPDDMAEDKTQEQEVQ
jgi:hypothetical protein